MVVSGWSVNGGMRNYDVVTDLVAERVEQTKTLGEAAVAGGSGRKISESA